MGKSEAGEGPRANPRPTILPVDGIFPAVRFLDQGGALVIDPKAVPDNKISGSIERGKYYRVIKPTPTRGLAKYGGNFDLLDQDGHFRIPEPAFKSKERRTWRASLTIGEKIEFGTLKNNVLELFGVKSLPEIRDVLIDPTRREERTIEAYRIIARRFGIQGSDEYIKGKIEGVVMPDGERVGFHPTAIKERARLATTIAKPRAFELSNNVATTTNVLELLGMVFFGESKQIRFEAAKILDGMETAASADRIRRQEETARFLASPHTRTAEASQEGSDKKDLDITEIGGILERYFYGSNPPTESTLLLSRHSPDDFRCIGVQRVPDKQARIARYKRPPKGHLYTELPERTIQLDGEEILAYTTVRRKSLESTVTKGKRKGTKNLRKAVEDAIGMRVVVQNTNDIPQVHDKLVEAFKAAGYSFTLLELEDSLSGGSFSAKNPGSSEKLRVVKIIAEIGPWLVETQYQNHEAFIDSTAQDGVSHKEFELSRLYDSGVPQHDFPVNIYGQPLEKVRDARISEIRRGIRIGLFRDDPDL